MGERPARVTRRQALASATGAIVVGSAGCLGDLFPGERRDAYHVGALEIVNAHDRAHEVLVVLTADDEARFARHVTLPPATHDATGVDSTNRWWPDPVSEPAPYRLHAKVDDRSVRTHRYAAAETAGDCLRAVVWLDRKDGTLAFDQIDCAEGTG